MGERKVLNRYVPPDFDPSIIPKFKRNKDTKIEVRMMLPFSMRCNTCGEYMYMGKKFNSKSEIVKGEDYMGIRKFRFYIKCCVCSAEITFKTDPQNSGYTCESGASRNFEMWRDTELATDEARKIREDEDEADAMKALENRTMDSKIEMDVLDALDEIKAINQRHERIDTNKLISALHKNDQPVVDDRNVVNKTTGVTLADEELIKSIKFRGSSKPVNTEDDSGGEEGVSTLKPLAVVTSSVKALSSASCVNTGESTSGELLAAINRQTKPAVAALVPTIIRKKRKVEETPITGTQNSQAAQTVIVSAAATQPPLPTVVAAASGGLLGGLLMGYGDSDEE
jgi:hypothetical protein